MKLYKQHPSYELENLLDILLKILLFALFVGVVSLLGLSCVALLRWQARAYARRPVAVRRAYT
jgi:hypothetical protein